MSTFIFPLNTVLFPGGTLPLKIFEQRYLEMTKACIRDEQPFGICLIKEGREVGTPAFMTGAFELGGLTITWNRLYIMLFAGVIFAALVVSVVNLLVDLSYAALDPRIQYS